MNIPGKLSTLVPMVAFAAGCWSGPVDGPAEYDGPNPFLEVHQTSSGKEDTGYVNNRGAEVHATIEAEVEASTYQIFNAPGEQAQFAVTYLRERKDVYLEILAEDTGTPDRVEWLVDGAWLTSDQARQVDKSKLRRWRIREANVVVLGTKADNVSAGQVWESPVALKPYSIENDAGDKCASYNSHIERSQSVYWYLWYPNKSACPDELKTTMTITVEEVLPKNVESYPEYDKLWEDGKLTVAVFWAKLDDGDVEDDYNWSNFNRFVSWLEEAGFEEVDSSLGKRLVKQVGELTEEVDVYGPDVFHSVADYTRFSNWQQAVANHEIVMYNGHSVLGTGMAFEQANYPSFYQIFQVASCLSYEYYVQPVLQGKGDWESVDVLSNVEPTYYSENLPLTSAVLAKLMYGFESEGRASWQDVMEHVRSKLGHYRFGISGARENCWTPNGNRCEDPGPEPDEVRYEDAPSLQIPDNAPDGVTATIEVPDRAAIQSLRVELDVAHTWVGDLVVTVEHDGVSHTLWNRAGGGDDDLRGDFEADPFVGMDASGTWTLRISDHASRDTGVVEKWALVFVLDGEPDPDPDPDESLFELSPQADIPDDDTDGITSVIEVPDSMRITGLQVELDVSHTYIGDLVITLEHDGVRQTLWNREGGSASDIQKAFQPAGFGGMDARGSWTLTVSDHAARDTGVLKRWSIAVTTDGGEPEPEPEKIRYESSNPVDIPDNDENGVRSTIEVAEDVTVAGLEISLDVTHTYVGDLVVVLEHDGTEVVVRDRRGGSADFIQETLQVADFDGMQAAGTWTLTISDRANIDTGTLDRWGLAITPAR